MARWVQGWWRCLGNSFYSPDVVVIRRKGGPPYFPRLYARALESVTPDTAKCRSRVASFAVLQHTSSTWFIERVPSDDGW